MTTTLNEIMLARPLRTAQSSSLPPVVETIREALKMIACLDRASRATLHWRLALNVLEYAQMVKDPEVIELATDAVENALSSDNWLAHI